MSGGTRHDLPMLCHQAKAVAFVLAKTVSRERQRLVPIRPLALLHRPEQLADPQLAPAAGGLDLVPLITVGQIATKRGSPPFASAIVVFRPVAAREQLEPR